MNEKGSDSTKKSLIHSIQNLDNKAARLNDLQVLSYKILKTMKHPFPEPEPNDLGGDKAAEEQLENPDIIEAFDRIADKMNNLINQINNNLGIVLDMIG